MKGNYPARSVSMPNGDDNEQNGQDNDEDDEDEDECAKAD